MQKVHFYFSTSQEAERAAQLLESILGIGDYVVLRVWNHVELWRVGGDAMTPSDLIKVGETMILQSWKKAV